MTQTFRDLGLSPELLETLDELGYVEPTAIQEQAIPPMRCLWSVSNRDRQDGSIYLALDSTTLSRGLTNVGTVAHS